MNESSDEPFCINTHDVVWREIGDELVVLQISTATYLSINGSGRTLWKRLVDCATPTELVEALTERYGIEAEVARRDVDGFVASLIACGLIADKP